MFTSMSSSIINSQRKNNPNAQLRHRRGAGSCFSLSALEDSQAASRDKSGCHGKCPGWEVRTPGSTFTSIPLDWLPLGKPISSEGFRFFCDL